MQGPSRYRKIREWSEKGQTYTTTLVQNGTRSWFRDRRTQLTTFPEKAGFHEESFLHWIALRLDFTDRSLTLSPLRENSINNREVKGIRVTCSDLPDVEFELFFDNKTGLLAKLVTKRNKKDSVPEERVFSEYKETRKSLLPTLHCVLYTT